MNHILKVLLSIGAALSLSCTLFAEAKSAVKPTVTKQKDNRVSIEFKVEPASGTSINTEGPWSLTLEDPVDASLFAKTKLIRSDFSEKLPGFVVQSTKPLKAGTELKYTAVTFTCTKNKEQCFRDVHKGSVKI